MAPSLDIQLRIGPEDDFQDELAIFGGQTRVVTNKFLSRKKARIYAKPRDASATVPLSPPATSASSTPAPGGASQSQSAATPLTASTPSDDGLPLTDGEGKELSKNASKGVVKAHKAQKAAHEKFLKWQAEGGA